MGLHGWGQGCRGLAIMEWDQDPVQIVGGVMKTSVRVF